MLVGAEKYVGIEPVWVDRNWSPSVIVAVHNGEPLVLIVSPETKEKFDEAMVRLGLTHVELANRLRDSILAGCGEFCEIAVLATLRSKDFTAGRVGA